jgi:large subunit ribosomal protein L25
MPAVLYGHQGSESVSLTLDAKDAETLVRKASLNNTLIQVKIPDLPWSGKALLREVQTHPWRRSIYHISFFSIAAQSSVEVTVPINFIGEAIGVKMGGGALDTVLTELQVQCDPEAIPETIEVDVTDFQVGDSVHVNELKLPKGVVAVGEPDRVVVSVLAGRTSGEDGDADESDSASE